MMTKRGCLLAFVVVSTGLLTAQHVVGNNRPANVPSDYVVTPFGYMHTSCVQTIKEGETLLVNGMIQHVDGSRTGGVPCSHQTITSDGTPKVEHPQAVTPEINGWVEDTATVAPANHSFSAIYNVNKVPPLPTNDEGQTLFFFPGLEDISGVVSILQPVLTYFDHSWYVSNWNCCINGITTNSTPLYTTPGHYIVSSTTENCKPNTLSCKTWNITSVDAQTKRSTTLSKTPSDGQVFNWAFAAVMEVYNVNSCADYPSESETYKTQLFDEKFNLTKPKWTAASPTISTPQCGYGITQDRDDNRDDKFTLNYSDKTASTFTMAVSPTSGTISQASSVVTVDVTISNLSAGGSVSISPGAFPIGVNYAWSIPNESWDGGPAIINQNLTARLIVADSTTTPATPATVTVPLTATMAGSPTVTTHLTVITQ